MCNIGAWETVWGRELEKQTFIEIEHIKRQIQIMPCPYLCITRRDRDCWDSDKFSRCANSSNSINVPFLEYFYLATNNSK